MTALLPSRPLEPALQDRLTLQVIRPRRSTGFGVPRPISRLLGVALVLVGWQIASATGRLPETIVGSPVDVWRTARHLIADGELTTALQVSLVRVALGLAIGIVVGTTLAVVAGLFRIGEDLFDAPVQMLRTVPFAGIIPLLIIWLGVGERPKIVLIALGVTFPALPQPDRRHPLGRSWTDRGRSNARSRPNRLDPTRVLPAALPSFLVGLRFALGISWLALVFAEQISATSGLGYLMTSAQELLQTNTIVVCLVIYALLGLLADLSVRGLERVLLGLATAPSGGVNPMPPTAPGRGRSPRGRRRRPRPFLRRQSGARPTWTCRSPTASSSRCSEPVGAARARCCASWPGSIPTSAGEVAIARRARGRVPDAPLAAVEAGLAQRHRRRARRQPRARPNAHWPRSV